MKQYKVEYFDRYIWKNTDGKYHRLDGPAIIMKVNSVHNVIIYIMDFLILCFLGQNSLIITDVILKANNLQNISIKKKLKNIKRKCYYNKIIMPLLQKYEFKSLLDLQK